MDRQIVAYVCQAVAYLCLWKHV